MSYPEGPRLPTPSRCVCRLPSGVHAKGWMIVVGLGHSQAERRTCGGVLIPRSRRRPGLPRMPAHSGAGETRTLNPVNGSQGLSLARYFTLRRGSVGAVRLELTLSTVWTWSLCPLEYAPMFLTPNVCVCEWQFGHRNLKYSLRLSQVLPLM